MAIKLTYDPEVDALYIRLVEGRYEVRTLRLTDQIALDIGPEELLVGVEILDVKEVIGNGKVPDVTVENLEVTQPA